MPWYASPRLTPAAERAINALGGNAARIAVLGFIVDHPASLVSEIADGTGLAVGTVKNHLAALTPLGVLDTDPAPEIPYEERRGRRTKYTARLGLLSAHYAELGRLLGLDRGTAPSSPE